MRNVTFVAHANRPTLVPKIHVISMILQDHIGQCPLCEILQGNPQVLRGQKVGS